MGKSGVLGCCFGLLVLLVATGSFGQSSPIENQTQVAITSVWNVATNLYVGQVSGGNGLTIANGGRVSTEYYVYVGEGPSANSNLVVISGAGSELSCNGTRVGSRGSFNELRIEDGGAFRSSIAGFYSAVGDWAGSDHNRLTVDGSNSLWEANFIAVGNKSSFNNLSVVRGGHVVANVSMLIGRENGAALNRVDVSGTGSRVDVSRHLYMGCEWTDSVTNVTDSGGTGNAAAVEDGGVFNVLLNIYNRNQSLIQVAPASKVYCRQDYFQDTGAELRIICAPDSANSGQLIVMGNASLGGILTIETDAGFVPSAGYSVRVMNISGETKGQFASVSLPVLPALLSWDTSMLYSNGTLVVVGKKDPGLVYGSKWLDLNSNGVREVQEPPLKNWKIYTDLNDNQTFDEGEPFALTDTNGNYVLTVPGGLNSIGEILPAEWLQTYPGGFGDADFSATLSVSNTCYAPNVLNYAFTKLPPAIGDGTLSIYAVADLNGSTEYIELSADGISLGTIFTTGGYQMLPSETIVSLPLSILNELLADGASTFRATPSSSVNNLGATELRLTLQYPAMNGLHSVDVGSGGSVSNINFGNVITGLYVNVVLPDAVTEGDGSVSGQLQLGHPCYVDTMLSLFSDDPTELSVPSNVMIPAGESNAVFEVVVVDDAQRDGSQPVSIRVSSAGYRSGTCAVLVHDNETAALALALPQTTFEGAGSISGVVTVTPAPDTDISVELISNHPAKIPGKRIVVAAGMTVASFSLDVLDDNLMDGVQTATISAHVENWQNGSASVFIFDNESSALSVSLPESSVEGDGLLTNAGVVSASGVAVTDIQVALASTDLSEISVPAFVTIPQGASSVSFDIAVQDDAETDGQQLSSVIASSPGFVPAFDSMLVFDNEVHHFTCGIVDSQQVAGIAFAWSVVAESVDGVVLSAYDASVGLSAHGDAGFLPVVPSSLNCSNGLWSGNVSIGGIGINVVLVVDDGAGHSGTSSVFNVSGSSIIITPEALTNTLVVAGESITRTMVISNAGNVDLEFEIQGVGSEEEPQDPSLIAYYPFNGNANDASGNGHDGTEMGSFSYTNGISGPAAVFNGTNSKIQIPHDENLNLDDHFTISLWIKSNGANPYVGLLSKIQSNVPRNGYLLNANTSLGDVMMGMNKSWPSVQGYASSTNSVLDGKWRHIVTTYDNANLSLYVDDQLHMRVAYTNGLSINSMPLYIGWDPYYITSQQRYFNGEMDELRIYNRALSESEISDLYNETDGDAGLIASYPFNGNAADESGNGHDGTVSGATLTADRFGNANSAYRFDGINDLIAVPDHADFTVSDVSIVAWIRTTDASDHKHITSCYGIESDSDWHSLYVRSGSGVAAWQVDPGGTVTPPYSLGTTSLVDGEWHLLVGVRDTSTARLKVYVDGVLESTSSDISTNALDPNVDFWIGGQNSFSTRFFNGDIDDVRIYSRALSAAEIAELYNETDGDAGLIASYPFNGNAADESGNGHDGTVSGATLTTDRFGHADSAYLFDGVNDCIEVPDSTTLRLSGTDFTVSTWVYETARNTSYSDAMIAKRGSGNGWFSGIVGSAAGSTLSGKLGYQVSGGVDRYSSASIPLNAWTHTVMTYDLASQTMRFYINGILDSETTGIPSPNAATTANLVIGRDSASTSYAFHGALDDVRIYSRGLSELEIIDLYNEMDGDAGLIASYPFNGNADDESGNGHDGTVSGATLTTNRFGNADSAFYFDGVNDRIDLAKEALDFERTEPFTQSFWIRTSDSSIGNEMVAKMDPNGVHKGISVSLYSGYLRVQLINSHLYNAIRVEGASILSDDLWHHVVVSYDGSSRASGISLYVDGSPEVTLRYNDNLTGSILNDIAPSIGARVSEQYYQGTLDDLRIYNRALSESEISDLYNETDGGEDPGSASWISANSISGIVAPGSSVNIALNFDAAGMVAGDHTNADLVVVCNDVLSISNGVPVSMYVVPPAPGMVAEPEFTTGGSNTVAWSMVDGPVSYWVEVATATNVAAAQDSGWIDATNHTFGALAANTLYFFRAKASVDSEIGRLAGPWSDWVWSTQMPDLTDSDGDGLPNWWEQMYYGGPTNANPLADADGDGQDNRAEFIAGMDPTNAWSTFMVNTVDSPTNGVFMLSWDAVTGRVYSVGWKDCMTNAFQTLEDNIHPPQNSYTDSVHATEECGFYVIKVELDGAPSAPLSVPPVP